MARQHLARLPLDPVSAGRARQLVAETLTVAGHPGWVDAAVLAVSEVVTNAVLHANTPCELSMDVGPDGARVSVRDFNPMLPTERHFSDEATTGRGLRLVGRISADFGVEPLGPDGKVVWFLINDEDGGPDDVAPLWDVSGLLDDEPTPPPGRFGPETARHAPASTDLVVRLGGVPTTLWRAGLEHYAAMVRELYLHQATHSRGGHGERLHLAEAGAALSALVAATDEALAADPGAGSIDLAVRVPEQDTSVFGVLQDSLDVGNALARSGRLLIRPALNEVVALRDWACDQAVAQGAGVLARRWDVVPQQPATVLPALSRPDWDDTLVRHSTEALVAADDTNRFVAVSAPAARLLGRTPDELVGQRITAIIPERLRESHVAGFSRHLTTGETHLIGIESELPALHADGSERMLMVLIQPSPSRDGRSVFVARLRAVGDDSAAG